LVAFIFGPAEEIERVGIGFFVETVTFVFEGVGTDFTATFAVDLGADFGVEAFAVILGAVARLVEADFVFAFTVGAAT